jgi:hypothetical protein
MKCLLSKVYRMGLLAFDAIDARREAARSGDQRWDTQKQ